MAANVKAVINFTTKTLTVTKWSGISIDMKILLWVIDPLGTTIYKNTGYDTSVFTSPDIDEAEELTLVIPLTEDDEGNILQGVYSIKSISEVDGKNYVNDIITITYCITLPIVDIDIEYSCLRAEIISIDVTDYALKCACTNSNISVGTTVLSHIVSYPTTMEVPIADVSSTTSKITITPIWTKRWVSRISNYLTYKMPIGTFTGDILYEVVGTLSGIAYKDVLCSDCLCTMYVCMKKMFSNYMNEMGRNEALASRYMALLVRMNALYMLYAVAQACSNEKELRDICSQIEAIINLSGCVCCIDDDSDEYSVEVIPVIAGSGSSVFGGTKWYYGDGVPNSSVGNIDDFYLDTTNKSVYIKTSGGWVLQFTMELTGQFGNMIHDFDYDKSTVNSSIFSLLKEYKFSTPDLENGSCLSLIANIWFDEPTNVNTAIMVSLLGNTETQFTIPVNTSFDADKFSTVLEVEYYVQVSGSTFTVVGALARLTGSNGIMYYYYKNTNVLLLSLNNKIGIYGRSNGIRDINLCTSKLVIENRF